MKKTLFRLLSVLLLTAMLFGNAFATTWSPQEFVCPIDNTKNTFLVVMSYGSYIYSWESKYQWLFFPQTDSPTYYTCKKCHLTTYMWDFDKLPKEKLPEIKKILAAIKVSREFKDYQELPVTERLEIMEKVYPALGKDDDWWASFYRVEGYHYGKAGSVAKAAEARRKSLALVEKELNNPKSETPQKLLFYISASMKHFLGDDKGALEDLQKALTTKYQDKKTKAKELNSAEVGLNERINDYVQKINSTDKKPRFRDKTDNEH